MTKSSIVHYHIDFRGLNLADMFLEKSWNWKILRNVWGSNKHQQVSAISLFGSVIRKEEIAMYKVRDEAMARLWNYTIFYIEGEQKNREDFATAVAFAWDLEIDKLSTDVSKAADATMMNELFHEALGTYLDTTKKITTSL